MAVLLKCFLDAERNIKKLCVKLESFDKQKIVIETKTDIYRVSKGEIKNEHGWSEKSLTLKTSVQRSQVNLNTTNAGKVKTKITEN